MIKWRFEIRKENRKEWHACATNLSNWRAYPRLFDSRKKAENAVYDFQHKFRIPNEEIEWIGLEPLPDWQNDETADTPAQDAIVRKCDELKSLLLEKNRKYGNSALSPLRVFSKADAVEQILVRIDDKLNRIKNRQNDEDEDVIMDLAGYLILLMAAREKIND